MATSLSRTRCVSMERVTERVAAMWGVSVADLAGPRRTRRCTEPRHVAMWIARNQTIASFEDIGRCLGRKHHTTVIYAVNQVERRRTESPAFAHMVDSVVRSLREVSAERSTGTCEPQGHLGDTKEGVGA